MEEKVCTKCGRTLALTCFSKTGRKRGSYESQCKECRSQYYFQNKKYFQKKHKDYYEKNKEQVLQSVAEYRNKNLDVISQKKKQYRQNNKEKLSEWMSSYYQRHKELIVFRSRERYKNNGEAIRNRISQYFKNHPEKRRHFTQIRMARKKKLPATFTENQWNDLKQKFGNRCAYCGEEKPLTQDHFIPLVKGGEYTINNIIPCCKSCNCSKQSKNFLEWYPRHPRYSQQREQFILNFLGYKDGVQQLRII